MGTINYGSNKYINMGMNLSVYDNIYNYENRQFEYETELQFLYDEIEHILKQYNFEYFTIKLEPGYYEGFYIDIDFDYLWVDYYEKPLILKELTQLKQFLLQCCNYGMVKYSSGWCMGYYNEEETRKAIKKCIRNTKEDIKKYPTYRTYKKGA